MTATRCFYLPLVTALTLAWVRAPHAQVALGVELPLMQMLICPTLAAATAQAGHSKAFGAGPPPGNGHAWDLGTSRYCQVSQVEVTPQRIEPAIIPFITWAERPDAKGKLTADIQYNGRIVQISVTPEHQWARYYYAHIVVVPGKRVMGWVEIPDRPYALEYLKANRR